MANKTASGTDEYVLNRDHLAQTRCVHLLLFKILDSPKTDAIMKAQLTTLPLEGRTRVPLASKHSS